jgi:hypothetical protein
MVAVIKIKIKIKIDFFMQHQENINSNQQNPQQQQQQYQYGNERLCDSKNFTSCIQRGRYLFIMDYTPLCM